MNVEREVLKRQYGKLFASISEALFKADPVGISYETDEYDPEAARSFRALARRSQRKMFRASYTKNSVVGSTRSLQDQGTNMLPSRRRFGCFGAHSILRNLRPNSERPNRRQGRFDTWQTPRSPSSSAAQQRS